MRVIPEGAGIRRPELVDEFGARLDRRLRQIGHAVHGVRQADAMPVDAGVLGKPVDQADAQRVAQLDAQRRRRKRIGIAPAGGDRGSVARQREGPWRSDDLLLGGCCRTAERDAGQATADGEAGAEHDTPARRPHAHCRRHGWPANPPILLVYWVLTADGLSRLSEPSSLILRPSAVTTASTEWACVTRACTAVSTILLPSGLSGPIIWS